MSLMQDDESKPVGLNFIQVSACSRPRNRTGLCARMHKFSQEVRSMLT